MKEAAKAPICGWDCPLQDLGFEGAGHLDYPLMGGVDLNRSVLPIAFGISFQGNIM